MKIRRLARAILALFLLVVCYNSYLPKFSETKLGYLSHIQFRPNPLAN